MVKHVEITVNSLQEHFDNGVFVPKYEKYSVIPEDMYTKPCSVPIIIRSKDWCLGLDYTQSVI